MSQVYNFSGMPFLPISGSPPDSTQPSSSEVHSAEMRPLKRKRSHDDDGPSVKLKTFDSSTLSHDFQAVKGYHHGHEQLLQDSRHCSDSKWPTHSLFQGQDQIEDVLRTEMGKLQQELDRSKERETRLQLDLLREQNYRQTETDRILHNGQARLARAISNFDTRYGELDEEWERKMKATQTNYKKHLERLETQNQVLSADRNLAHNTTDHMRCIVKTQDEDLQELLRISNEEAAQRDRDRQGLPPEYGTQDNGQNDLSCSRHSDGGSLWVNNIVHHVKGDFRLKLSQCQISHRASLLGGNHAQRVLAGNNLFVKLSSAFSRTCHALNDLLDKADDVNNPSLSEHCDPWTAGSSVRRSADPSVRNPTRSNCSYLGSKIADLVQDIVWRLISTLSVHSFRNLCESDRITVQQAWRLVDDTLYKALTCAFSSDRAYQRSRCCPVYPFCQDSAQIAVHCTCFTEKLLELQRLEALVRALGPRLRGIYDPHYPIRPTEAQSLDRYFKRSLEWLADNIEAERPLAAKIPNDTLRYIKEVFEQEATAFDLSSFVETRPHPSIALEPHTVDTPGFVLATVLRGTPPLDWTSEELKSFAEKWVGRLLPKVCK